MIIGCVKETFPGERRVALSPNVLGALTKAGWEVLIESDCGREAGFRDQAYLDKGARTTTRAEVFASADVLVQVRAYGANPQSGAADLSALRKGQVLIGMFDPLSAVEQVKQVAERGVSLFAMEMIPRITRAQSMDVLSSMATIAGYKAVLIAASHLSKMFPMMMTAAGTVAPAKAFVIGAGVAGLQAIASARRLGAQVEAYDLRPAVKEQVQSLGAKFVEMELDAGDAETGGGYAKAMGEEFYRKQRELMARVVAQSDAVICTAAIPGKQAPLLVTQAMVESMPAGAVIVDLAAERGGNCELTRAGEVVRHHDVTVIGPLNLASEVPLDASQMYAKNVSTLVLLMTKDGKLNLNLADQVIRETLVAHRGEITNAVIRQTLGLAEATT